MERNMPVNLESNTFEAMKADMTAALGGLLRLMQTYGESKGQLMLRLNVNLESGMDNGEKVVVPYFEHKVTTTVQRKDELGGQMGGDLTLVKDPLGGYVLRAFSGQVDMFSPESWSGPDGMMPE